jgi:DnaJ-domain-containing protein 1
MTNSNQDLANEIDAWHAASQQSVPSLAVQELRAELRKATPDLKSWAGINLLHVIPFRIPKQKFAENLDILRNALVLLPIALTWIGLWQAAKSFSAASATAREELNFLVYWERDVSGLFRLSTIAVIDFALLFMVFLMTVVSEWVGRPGERQAALERRHETLIANLERGLAQYRYVSLNDLNQYADQIVRNIGSATNNVEAATQQLAGLVQSSQATVDAMEMVVTSAVQPAMSQISAVLQNLSSAAGAHQNLTQIVQQAQVGLATTQGQLAQTVTAISGAIQSSLAQSQQALDASLRTAQNSHQSALQSLDTGLQTLISDLARTTSDTLVRSVQQAAAVVNQVSQSASSSATSLTDAAQAIAEVSVDLKAVLASVELGVTNLNNDLASISKQLVAISQRLP